ncbi:TPA: hypothetical protein ACV5GZ_005487 [Bacillus thuringiensis]
MLRHIASFLLGTFVMIIGYVWVIPYTLEAIDSNVSYIAHHKKYFSKLYKYDINLWIIAMLIFFIFTAISVLILKLPDYKKNKHTKISSAYQGIGSHYYFLYSRSEERVVGALGS